jgi:adenylate cyclase
MISSFRRILVTAGIGAGAALLAWGLARAPLSRTLIEPVELLTQDWRVRSQPVQLPDSSEVRLVLFDQGTVEQWPYLMPFPRAALAELIDALSSAGAAAIGLDVFLDRLYPELGGLDQGDVRLRAAMERAGNVVLVAATEGTDARRRLIRPHPYFAAVAAGIGTADLPTPHETVREGVLTVRTDSALVPGFALALYAQVRELELDSLLHAALSEGELRLPGLPRSQAMLPHAIATQTKPIHFRGPPSRPDYGDDEVPSFHVASGSVAPALAQFAPEFFRGKIVLLGSGFHAEERFRSPHYFATRASGEQYGWTYGVEIHAHILDNLLSGKHPVLPSSSGVLGLLLTVGLLVSTAVFTRGVPAGALAVLLVVAAVTSLAWIVFDRSYLLLPLVSPALAALLSFLGATWYVSVLEGRRAREIRRMFSRYVSPAVVDQLIAEPDRLKLGGEKRTITILFSDLAGFTTISEQMEPERLITLLNRYLNEMVEIVKAERGLKDKFIGDAVMALFGTPQELPDHALRACRAALEMQRRLELLNAQWQSEQLPRLSMRIGINTGSPVVGNIGGADQFDYTALGDDVNLAARLEPACKEYGVEILISESTLRMAGDSVRVRFVDLLAVYGRVQPVRIYELVSLGGEGLPAARAELLSLYEMGMAAYERRDWGLALQYFSAAAELDPLDRPSGIYLARCEEFSHSPPAPEWDFVQRSRSK